MHKKCYNFKESRSDSMKKKILTGIFAFFMITSFFVIIFISGFYILLKGPSPKLTELVVTSLKENSKGGSIADWYLSQEEIDEILDTNKIIEYTQEVSSSNTFNNDDLDMDEIIIEEVSGPTFKGHIMIVNNPDRVSVETVSDNCLTCMKNTGDLIEMKGGIAGVNGGGFFDNPSKESYGIPNGHVIKDGKSVGVTQSVARSLVGFDYDNNMIVGYFTTNQALKAGIRDALTFGPILIVNGEASKIYGNSGGLNPRNVIGQREDGAVLFLSIDGRQTNSLGATYRDCIEIMLEYGAVTAYNLDGGSSATLYYDGELISNPSNLMGSRAVPTIFMVK